MRNASNILRERQRAIRRELDRRGVSLKALSFDSDIPYSTLCSYFPGNERGMVERQPAEMPSSAAYSLCGHLPDDLLNLLCPEGFAVVRIPNGLDHDELCEAMQDYLAEKAKAHRPDSPQGPAIAPCEDNVLRGKFAKVKAA